MKSIKLTDEQDAVLYEFLNQYLQQEGTLLVGDNEMEPEEVEKVILEIMEKLS